MQNPQNPYENPSPIPPPGGALPPSGPVAGADKKLVAGICGILLGALGVHKFILGYNTEGIIMLVASLVGAWLTCGISAGVMGVIGLIEGIIYLTKSDQEFIQTYINNKKTWF